MPSLRTFCRTQDHKDFSPWFSSRSFILLRFIFGAMIHLELAFARGVSVRECSEGDRLELGQQALPRGAGLFLGV